jgi:hypothetical protein
MRAGAEAGVVPVGQGAGRVGGRQVGEQPVELRRPRAAPSNELAVRIEHDDVPRAGLVGVPALARRAGSGAEVREVGGAPIVLGVVVADGGSRAIQVSAP